MIKKISKRKYKTCQAQTEIKNTHWKQTSDAMQFFHSEFAFTKEK